MYTIQTNASGTRSMEISEENLQTIEKYALFQHLIDSNGIVDESVLYRGAALYAYCAARYLDEHRD